MVISLAARRNRRRAGRVRRPHDNRAVKAHLDLQVRLGTTVILIRARLRGFHPIPEMAIVHHAALTGRCVMSMMLSGTSTSTVRALTVPVSFPEYTMTEVSPSLPITTAEAGRAMQGKGQAVGLSHICCFGVEFPHNQRKPFITGRKGGVKLDIGVAARPLKQDLGYVDLDPQFGHVVQAHHWRAGRDRREIGDVPRGNQRLEGRAEAAAACECCIKQRKSSVILIYCRWYMVSHCQVSRITWTLNRDSPLLPLRRFYLNLLFHGLSSRNILEVAPDF